MNRVALLAATVLAAGTFTACGDGGGVLPLGMDSAVQSQLRRDVRTVAAAFADHRRNRAQAALAALDADADAAFAAGKLSEAQLADIRAAVARLTADSEHFAPAPTPTVTVTKAPPPPPKRHGGGKHGKGGGGEGGDG